VVLDLHCDDEGPVYLYTAERQLDEGRRLARALGATVILTDGGTDPLSFDMAVGARWAAENRPGDQRFAATVEFRGMMDVTPDLAKRDAAGLYRYLVDLGAVSDPLDAYDPADPVVGDVDDAQLIPTPARRPSVRCECWRLGHGRAAAGDRSVRGRRRTLRGALTFRRAGDDAP
jgi:predicted deacylase